MMRPAWNVWRIFVGPRTGQRLACDHVRTGIDLYRPVERVDSFLDAHLAWLSTHYEAGTFIASGRKNPRDGGVILAVGDDREEMERLVATDPFATGGVCEYRVTEFIATRTAPALANYRQQQGT